MYEVRVNSSFSAAHYLRNYKGKCENLHGHNWKVQVKVSSLSLNPQGMTIDFGDLKKILAKILNELDHKHLNDLDYFQEKNPSSEEIARYIYEKVKESIDNKECFLKEVRVWETDTASAGYSEP